MKISSTGQWNFRHSVWRSGSGRSQVSTNSFGLVGPKTSAQLPDVLAPFDSHAWRSSGASVSLCCTKRFINSAGTGWAKTASAAGLRSRESLSTPASFSTCTIRTVCSRPSIVRRCFISAANARASTAAESSDKGESRSGVSPLSSCTRGKRFGSRFTHTGA